MKIMTETEFTKRLQTLPKTLITKAHGKKYHNVHVEDSKVHGIKESGDVFAIRISELYEAYIKDDYHTSSALLNYVTGRNGAPALAIFDYIMSGVDTSSDVMPVSQDVRASQLKVEQEVCKSREKSDESYVIDLCDEALGRVASRQHRFPFLLGDGDNPKYLPVDAYYDDLKLVVEYYELQHTEAVPFYDKPDKMTVSGVSRGEQRKSYDRRRREVLPQHGIALVIINYSDFRYEQSKSKRLVRDHDHDLEVVRTKLKEYLNR